MVDDRALWGRQMTENLPAQKSAVDWDAVERDYRTGQFSNRELGRRHNVTHRSIALRAEKEKWAKDLRAQIRAAVSTKLVSIPVPTDAEKKATDREIVEAAANREVSIIQEHRVGISRGRTLVELLMAELEGATINIDEIESAIETETAADIDGKRRASMLKAVSLGNRAGTMVSLSAALKNLITLERQAFNMDEKPPEDPAQRFAQMSPQERLQASAELVRRIAVLVEVRG